jgi:aerobic-type carbon monoxide dehydrogenase small subunit (CoxS/CutS family)
MRISIEVNQQQHELETEPRQTLAETLRDSLGLTATKVACGEGTCGSCTVVLDGRPTLSCLTLAAACDGASVRTAEGDGPVLDRLRETFTAHDGFQCGFCTPGQLMSALALLERNPSPDREQVIAAMSGNLCRCGAYEGIAEAVLAASGDSR